MSTAVLDSNVRTDRRPRTGVSRLGAALPPRLMAAALCVAVAVIHIKDQGGFPGHKEPSYIGMGYFLLELGAAAAAVLLLSKAYRKGWFLSLGVAAGPLIGYVLTRGPGLPLATDDRGNWTESIGVMSLVVEGVLLLLILAVAARRGAARSAEQSVRSAHVWS
ncbi:MAG: hypothetical protein QOF20_297 [Acidimicrobiaceae bacterium]|jgi:hypothetical protein|nr:hypothetical protein [Acidimicrobiaceae bacterium]MDQ1376730.1 hypothetical protein [Acidimicrobiaceae bacterium]MDQ1398990.1 hypothetical protein [Acidimicrobiaceae bacterium]MDQ1413789.1 hypothetical protein [Acidimicrobiaceae bacterium]MDQ1414733.1 hypothetical protein [Acidimicrobiaceae bacterium]